MSHAQCGDRVLSLYFVALGALACTASAAPFVAAALPRSLRGRAFELKKLTIPLLLPVGAARQQASPAVLASSEAPCLQDPTDWAVTWPEAVSGVAAGAFCVWYHQRRHWLANNILGLAFSIQGIEHLSLGAVQTGIILLSGLFAYGATQQTASIT